MSADTKPPKDRRQIIEDARLLRAEAQASRQHARKLRKKAARTREACVQTRRQAEEICLDVGLKVMLLQMVRQVIRERQQSRLPARSRYKAPKKRMHCRKQWDQEAWVRLGRLSTLTARVQ